MAKTLITWPQGSADGEREGKRLQALCPEASNWVDGASLGALTSKDFSLLIVVGHRDEIKGLDTLKALTQCINSLGIRFVAMANCESALAESGGTLSDKNELWSPAQRLANDTGAAVLATVRELLFDEVGKGSVFAISSTHGLMPIDPSDAPLWKEFRKQDPVDQVATGVGNL
jgi:hypothetical protein